MFRPVRLQKLFGAVVKEHIREVTDALLDSGACQFIEVKGSGKFLVATDYTYMFELWIAPARVSEVISKIETASCGKCALFCSEPSFGETPPVLLDNPKMMEPFENLVRSYGLPSYHEIDPTALIFITFPLMFGIMYGDIGHGILLLLIGIILLFSTDRLYPYLKKYKSYEIALIMCASSSIFFGIMYGEFFGFKLAPLWFSPPDNIIYFFYIAVWIAVIHMITGFSIKIINLWSNKKIIRVYCNILWIIFHLSVAVYILSYITFHDKIASYDMISFAKSILNLSIDFKILFLFPFLSLIFCNILTSYIEKGSIFKSAFSPVGFAIKQTFQIMSYFRVVVMAIAHSTISATIIKIAGGEGILSLFLASFITFLLIILVETFFVLLQTVRLHWVEWFYVFYEGKGKAFVVSNRTNVNLNV